MNLEAIRAALEEVINEVPEVRASGYALDQVATSSSGPTAVLVLPGEPYVLDFHETMSRGLATVQFRVGIVCQRADLRAAQQRVDELLSSGTGEFRSLIDVLQTNTARDGVWHHVHVARATGVGLREWNGVEYFGADLDVVVRVGRQ